MKGSLKKKRKRYTVDERIEILNQVYDEGLDWLLDAVVRRKTKSTGAVTSILERTRMEMIELERANSKSSSSDAKKYIIAYEYSLPETEVSQA